MLCMRYAYVVSLIGLTLVACSNQAVPTVTAARNAMSGMSAEQITACMGRPGTGPDTRQHDSVVVQHTQWCRRWPPDPDRPDFTVLSERTNVGRSAAVWFICGRVGVTASGSMHRRRNIQPGTG